MKIRDFHTRVCVAGDPNIGPLAASADCGMRASLELLEMFGEHGWNAASWTVS